METCKTAAQLAAQASSEAAAHTQKSTQCGGSYIIRKGRDTYLRSIRQFWSLVRASHCENDNEDEVQDDRDPVEGEGGSKAKQVDEPEGRFRPGPLEPDQSVTAGTSGFNHVGEIDPDEGEAEVGSSAESEEEDFVSFIGEEDVDSQLSTRVELEAEISNDSPLTCGGRIDTDRSMKSVKEPTGESRHFATSESIRAGQ